MSRNNIYILDAGHGGVDEQGNYLTAGKRSPIWKDGKVYYEGEGNRQIVSGIADLLESENIPYHVLVPESRDVPLWERVQRVNKLDTDLNKVVISVHSNGFHKESANGWQCNTSKSKQSKELASHFVKMAKKYLPPRFNMRRKELNSIVHSNFAILGNTKNIKHPYPAVLTENLFHTNRKDCLFLMSQKGQETIINIHFQAILSYEQRL